MRSTMFSNKNKPSDQSGTPVQDHGTSFSATQDSPRSSTATAPKKSETKAKPSVLSSELFVKGNLQTASDISVEGQVEGDIRARLLLIGENATVRGKMVGDEVVINGRVIGQVLGLRVRLNSSSRVEGDIIHETIAIEAGAHFEGTVKRKENPLSEGRPAKETATAPKSSQGAAVAPKKPGQGVSAES